MSLTVKSELTAMGVAWSASEQAPAVSSRSRSASTTAGAPSSPSSSAPRFGLFVAPVVIRPRLVDILDPAYFFVVGGVLTGLHLMAFDELNRKAADVLAESCLLAAGCHAVAEA